MANFTPERSDAIRANLINHVAENPAAPSAPRALGCRFRPRRPCSPAPGPRRERSPPPECSPPPRRPPPGNPHPPTLTRSPHPPG